MSSLRSLHGSADGTVSTKFLGVNGKSGLSLVVGFLILAPGLLTITLLLGHALVLKHDLALVFGSFLHVVVVEHATHSVDSLLLLSKGLLLLALGIGSSLSLTALLGGPLLLEFGILHHSLVVHCDRSVSVGKK